MLLGAQGSSRFCCGVHFSVDVRGASTSGCPLMSAEPGLRGCACRGRRPCRGGRRGHCLLGVHWVLLKWLLGIAP